MGGGMFQGIQLYMGIMCAAEAHRIYKLLKAQQLHTHPLFETARSDIVSSVDEFGAVRRLNTSDHDDEAPPLAVPGIQFREVRAFAGEGHSLAAPTPHQSQKQGNSLSREQWLERLESGAAER